MFDMHDIVIKKKYSTNRLIALSMAPSFSAHANWFTDHIPSCLAKKEFFSV